MNKRPAPAASKKQNIVGQEFLADFLDWYESAEGQRYDDLSYFINSSLEEITLDTKKRRFVFSKKQQLTFEEVAAWIQKKKNIKDLSEVYDALINWMEMGYGPKNIDIDDEDVSMKFEQDIEDWIDSL